MVLLSRSDYLNRLEVFHNQTHNTLFKQSDSMTQRFMTTNKQSISSWLNTLPILKDNFNLSSVELRNALCLRNFKTLLQLPPLCNGCGAPFTTTHALDCRKGELVIHRHHEIRDLFHDLSSLVWSCTTKEPVVRDGSLYDPPVETFIVDFSARVFGNHRPLPFLMFKLLTLMLHPTLIDPLLMSLGLLKERRS